MANLCRAALAVLALAAAPTALAATQNGDSFCSDVRALTPSPPLARPTANSQFGLPLTCRLAHTLLERRLSAVRLSRRTVSLPVRRSAQGNRGELGRVVLLSLRGDACPKRSRRLSPRLILAPRLPRQTRSAGQRPPSPPKMASAGSRCAFLIARACGRLLASTLLAAAVPLSRSQTRLNPSPTPCFPFLQRLRAANGQLAYGHRLAVPEQHAHVSASSVESGHADRR